MLQRHAFLLFVWAAVVAAWAQPAQPRPASQSPDGHPVIQLWPNGAPGSEGKDTEERTRINQQGEHIVSSVHQPSITVYLPAKDKNTGAAVIVTPGGGHRELWMDHEGYRVARWLSEHGIAGFVLKYRLAREEGSSYTVEGNALPDIQRAIRLVRSRAPEWGIDPDRLGVMGFSAGGQLAALAATRYDDPVLHVVDEIDRQNAKPAFQALIYAAFPQNMKLSKDTPQAFLACGGDDRIAAGTTDVYAALKKNGVPAELHIYAGVGHGFGIRETTPRGVSGWIDRFADWLYDRGLLSKK